MLAQASSYQLTQRVKMLTSSYGDFTLEFPNFYACDLGWYSHAEMQTKKFYLENIQPTWNIIDAGAQIGMYSVLFSRLTKGNVYSFEPTDTINLLNKNLEYHNCNNVQTFQKAISDRTGKFQDKVYKIWSQQVIEDREFDFIKIDDFIEQNNIKIDLIKIDVDSYDYEALISSENTLKTQSPLVVVELNYALKKRNRTVKECIDYMESLGYKQVGFFDNDNYAFRK